MNKEEISEIIWMMGVKCVGLSFPCPGIFCPKDKIKKWVHKDCGTKIYITEIGDIVCFDHYDSRDFIQSWRFKCNEDIHMGGYVGFTLASAGIALGYAIAAMEKYQTEDALAATQMLAKMQTLIYSRWKK